MTPDQSIHLEASLARRGYKLYTSCLIGNEDRAWFKSFGIHPDADGDPEPEYQIAWRMWDYTDADPDTPDEAAVWLTVTMLPNLPTGRIDVDISHQVYIPNIADTEALLSAIHQTIKRHLQ